MRKMKHQYQLEPPVVVPAEQAAEVFPAVRYFQIHFECLQEQIQQILSNQEALHQQLQNLESRLSISGQGLRVDPRTMSKLERLVAGHTAILDSEQSGFKRTAER